MQEVHPGAIQKCFEHIPMKRIGKPEEVSNMVLFLASEKSSYSTGVSFIFDGGVMAT